MGLFDGLFDGSTSANVDPDAIMSDLEKALGALAESAQRMAIETVDARSKDDLVRVWVNAQGVVVQVQVDEDLFCEATSAQVGESMREAAQAAAAKMRDKAQAFQADVWKQTSAVGGGLSGVGPMGDLSHFAQLQPTVPLSPPNSRERGLIAERLDAADADDDEPPEPPLTVSDRG